MKGAYTKAKRKSKWIKQFKCIDALHEERRWWGPATNSQCSVCHEIGTIVPLDEIIGIGWFCCSSPCGRLFAGFCRGSVKSKCHKCNTALTAMFVVPGARAAGTKKENAHHCEACHGESPCPIVELCRAIK